MADSTPAGTVAATKRPPQDARMTNTDVNAIQPNTDAGKDDPRDRPARENASLHVWQQSSDGGAAERVPD